MLGYVPNQGAIRESRAPVLSSASDTTTGVTTADLGVTTDEANGTLYAVVTTSATPPSKAQVKAGQNHAGAAAAYAGNQAISSTGAKTFSATGLSGSTAYYAHFMHEDAKGNQSAVASGDGFTTNTAVDTTAPVLSSPTDTQTGETTAQITVDTDEGNGTLYWVLSTSASAPSKAQIKAGQMHTGAAAAASGSAAVSGTGTRTVNPTGLTYGTTYYAHFMHEDAAGNQSNVSSGNGFTTANNVTPAATDYTASQTITCPDYHEMDWEPMGGGGGGGGESTGGGNGGDTSLKIAGIIQVIAYGGEGGMAFGAGGAGGDDLGSYNNADSGVEGGDGGSGQGFPARSGAGGNSGGPFGVNGPSGRTTAGNGANGNVPGSGAAGGLKGGSNFGAGGGQAGGYAKKTIRSTDIGAPVAGVTQLQITVGSGGTAGQGVTDGGTGARGQFRLTVR